MTVLEAGEEFFSQCFDDPLELLKKLRRTGVTAASDRSWWTPRRLTEFRRVYREKFGTPEQLVKLTWHPVYILAQIRKGDRI